MSDPQTIPTELPQQPHAMRDRFPIAYTILFGLIVVMASLSRFVPAGQYERAMNESGGFRTTAGCASSLRSC